MFYPYKRSVHFIDCGYLCAKSSVTSMQEQSHANSGYCPEKYLDVKTAVSKIKVLGVRV
jgi:hypothetical protein